MDICWDQLRPKDCAALIAVLPSLSLVRIQLYGKLFTKVSTSPDVSMVRVEPCGAVPPNDYLAKLRAKELPNPWEKSATMKHIDPGTVRLSRRPELILPLFKSLSRNLSHNQILSDFRLVGFKVPTTAWQVLALGLKASLSLEYLSLTYCRISDPEIAILSPAIESIVHLRKLDLSNNSLGNKAGFHIARIISLHSLHKDETIWKNNLRNTEISGEIEGCFLQEISLANNKLDDFSVFEICRALRLDTWIKALDLRRNDVGIEAVKEIWSVMQSNQHLLVVDVRETPAESRKETRQIIESLRRNFSKRGSEMPVSRRSLYHNHIKLLENTHCQTQRLGSAPVSPKNSARVSMSQINRTSLSPNSTACSPPSTFTSKPATLDLKYKDLRTSVSSTQISYRYAQKSKLEHLDALVSELSELLEGLAPDKSQVL